LRNNNLLNVRRTGKDQWKGLAAQQNDRAFCQFKSMEWGWCAFHTNLGERHFSILSLIDLDISEKLVNFAEERNYEPSSN